MNDPHDRLGWRALSPEAREREYSPSSCLGGNYAPFIAAYVLRSAQARRDAKRRGARWSLDRYGPGPANCVELAVPPSVVADGAPLLVFIHGGYWQELSAGESLFAADAYVARGVAFAAVDYTLAPAATLDTIVAECVAAVAHLHAQAASLGLDARRIVVAGSSAGAHLAAMVALELRDAVRACVLVSGVYDLEPLIGTSINEALSLDVAAARRVSPLLEPLDGFPPALVAWGEIETEQFKRQSAAFADALVAAGVRCERLEVRGRNHFDVILDLADPASALGRHTFARLTADSA